MPCHFSYLLRFQTYQYDQVTNILYIQSDFIVTYFDLSIFYEVHAPINFFSFPIYPYLIFCIFILN